MSTPNQGAWRTRTVHIGLLAPLLTPLQHEWRFWTSTLFKKAAADGDSIRLCIRVAESFLWWRMFQALPPPIAASFCDIFARKLLLVLAHVACKLAAAEFYNTSRWLLILHFRVYTLLTTLAVFRIARNYALQRQGGVLQPSKQLFEKKLVPGNPLLQGFRMAVFHSGSFIYLLPALPPSVPFILEVAMQLIALFDTVRNSLFTAGDLAISYNEPATTALCSAMTHIFPLPFRAPPQNILALLPRTGSWGMGSALGEPAGTGGAHGTLRIPATCGPQAPWLVMLWFSTFGVLVLPLYITYCCERHLKVQYAQQFEAPAPAGAAEPPAAAHPGPRTPAGTGALPGSVTLFLDSLSGLEAMNRYFPYLVLATRPCQPIAPRTLGQSLLRKLRSTCTHLLVLWLLGGACWHLVAAGPGHPWLAPHVVVPLVPALNLTWYWELLCGSDQPCCPAP